MIFLNKNFVGLKMVMKPKKTYKDKQDNPVKEEGESIQFVNGRYQTTDKKEIAFIQNYMKNHQGEITTINEKDVEKQKRIMAKAKELVEEEDAKKENDEYGKSKKKDVDDGQPNESLSPPFPPPTDKDDAPGPSTQPSKFMNMGIRKLRKTAKKMEIPMNDKQLNDIQWLRAKIIKAVRDLEAPDLTDESKS